MSKKKRKKSKKKKRKNGKEATSEGLATVIHNRDQFQPVASNTIPCPSDSSTPAAPDPKASTTLELSLWTWFKLICRFPTSDKEDSKHGFLPLSCKQLFISLAAAVCIIAIILYFSPQLFSTRSQPVSSTTSASSSDSTTSKTANVTINM